MSDFIYRVQDKQGRGPYKPGFSHKWCDEDVNLQDRPSFFQEFGTSFLKEFATWETGGCGFRTLDQLKWWFSRNELKRLIKLGYQVVKLEPSRILRESDKQLIFSSIRPLSERATKVPDKEVFK